MSVFNEKIIEELWDGMGPFISLTRIFLFIMFCLFISPYRNEFFSMESFLMEFGDMLDLIKNTFKETTILKLLFVLVATFVIAPYANYLSSKYLITKIHIHHAERLINTLSKKPSEKLTILLDKRNSGIGIVTRLKNIGEITSVALMAYTYYFLSNLNIPSIASTILAILFFTGAWLLGQYLFSQKVLITYLTEIAPFNIANEASLDKSNATELSRSDKV